MSYQDKTIICIDCHQQFIFSAEDQQYHAEKGFANEPKRCPKCRAARRSERNSSDRERYTTRDRAMYPAVCAQCGKQTEVPFQPRGDRPVYCNDCYRQRAGSSNHPYGPGSDSRH
jgi:CxxC-x17-CxxC domain-containing protein